MVANKRLVFIVALAAAGLAVGLVSGPSCAMDLLTDQAMAGVGGSGIFHTKCIGFSDCSTTCHFSFWQWGWFEDKPLSMPVCSESEWSDVCWNGTNQNCARIWKWPQANGGCTGEGEFIGYKGGEGCPPEQP